MRRTTMDPARLPTRAGSGDLGRRSSLRAAAAAAAICAASVLAGCAAAGSSFAVLERDPGPSDALPAGLPDYATDRILVGSQRFLGEHEGTSLWLARGADTETPGLEVCLLAYPDDTNWALGCGGAGQIELGGAAGSFTVVPDGQTPPGGLTAITPNVYAPAAR